MSAKQNIVIVSGLILTVILYLLRTTPEQKSAIDVLLYEGKASLSPAKLEQVEQLEERADDGDRQEVFSQISSFWEEEGNKGLAAVYAFRSAQNKQTAEAWRVSGEKFSAAYSIARERNLNSNLTFYLISAAEESYKKALELEPSNLETQLKLAEVYTDGQGDVMKGVQLLRGIVEKDPENIGANLTLGRFSLMSGQYDKAIDRLEVVIKNDPDNVEALVYLSNAYLATGNQEEAAVTLTSAAEFTEEEELKKEILKRLEEIKN